MTIYHVRKLPEGGMTRVPRDVALALPLEEQTGEARNYVIHLPFLPPSKNEWRAWDGPRKASVKRSWIRRIVRECEAQNMPRGLPKIGLAALLVFPSKLQRDPQNYAATLWEFVPDALEDKQHGSVLRRRNGEEYREPLWGYGMIPDDRAGRIDWPVNHGILFDYDLDKTRPAKDRRRTVISIGVLMP